LFCGVSLLSSLPGRCRSTARSGPTSLSTLGVANSLITALRVVGSGAD
jgi:hypothetical protein